MENSEKYLLFTVGVDKKTHELCVWVGGGNDIEEKDGITLDVVPKPSDLPKMASEAIESAVEGTLLSSQLEDLYSILHSKYYLTLIFN